MVWNKKNVHDEVEDGVLQHIIRKWLAILALEVHEQLQKILLRLVVALLTTSTDDVEREISHGLLVLGDDLPGSVEPLDDLPGALEETLAHDSVETVKGHSKVDFAFGVVQASE